MTPEEKKRREAEATAAALWLLSKKNVHGVQLAFVGAARRASSGMALSGAQAELSGAVEKAVASARGKARKLASEAFGRQTGVPVPLVGDSVDSKVVADSLSEQWATSVRKLAEVEGDTIGIEGWYEKAAKDLEWAAERTARNETYLAYNRESRDAYESLIEKGVTRVARIWLCELVNTCSICLPLHETEADAFGDFPEGEPPIHVTCYCWITTEIR